MYHNLIIPESCDELWQECQSLVSDLLKDCTIKSTNLIIDAENPIDLKGNSLYLIKEGDIYETFDGQIIVFYEKGDLVNADALTRPKITTYDHHFAVTVDEYDGQQFIDQMTSDKTKLLLWNQYISGLLQSFQILMCYFSRQDTEYLPETRHYKNGDIIIKEDSEGDEVFTLLHGTAKVISNNEEVGEIKEDEIFGAIAALTQTKRTATILATSDCDTLVTNSENFRSILDTRPDIVQKLIQDMARTIVSGNEKIIELSKDNV